MGLSRRCSFCWVWEPLPLATDDATDLEGIASADTFGDASPGDNDVEVVTMRASQNNTAALGRLGFSNTATITTSYTTDDSAAMFFDATTGGNHETETANGGTTQSSTAAVAEDTSYHQYDITIGASNAVLSVDGTSATHSTQYPNSAQYVRLETTDITNTFSVDHVFTRKLATTTPTVPAYGSYEAEEASPGPVAYWKFDEGVDNTCSGGTNDACDATGHGIDLSKTNATWRTEDECISGKCLRFEFDIPTQQYLTRTDDDQLDFDANTDFTLSGWFRHTSTPAGADNIITKRNTGIGYEVRMENLGYISFTIDNGSNSDIATSTANYADSKWHHFSAVKNGTTSINLYIDGVEVASDTSIAATGTLENSDDFYIGLDGDGAGGQWEGFLDEIKVYRYARSEAEIKSDYNQSYAAAFGPDNSWLSDGLIGYWKMDELSGNATDLSGNGTTLTNTGTTTFTGAKFGNGSEHNGSSQYFDVVDNAYLSVTGSLTLSAWINPDDTTGSQDIIGKWDGANESYLLAMEGANLRMYIDAAANYEATTGTPLSANTLQHVVGVYDASSQTVKLFVNGELQASSTTGTIPSSIGNDAGELVVGAEDSSGTPANYYDGHIDDLRVYKHALSPKQVQALYNWAPGPYRLLAN